MFCYLQRNYQGQLQPCVAPNSCQRTNKWESNDIQLLMNPLSDVSAGSLVNLYNTDHYPTRSDWLSRHIWGVLAGEKKKLIMCNWGKWGECRCTLSGLSVKQSTQKVRKSCMQNCDFLFFLPPKLLIDRFVLFVPCDWAFFRGKNIQLLWKYSWSLSPHLM